MRPINLIVHITSKYLHPAGIHIIIYYISQLFSYISKYNYIIKTINV